MGRVSAVTDYFAGRYELLEQIAYRRHGLGLVRP